MGKKSLKFNGVSFGYDSSIKNLISDFSVDITSDWIGVIGANGAGKSTFLKLATGMLKPDSGTVIFPENTIYCSQRTDVIPENFDSFVESYNKFSCKLMGLLDIDPEWQNRWDTLSHGERKRAQIATALYQRSDILAVDEPTNHLDSKTKEKIINGLLSFKGVGLLVSHDRDLLDRLCRKCIFIEPPDLSIINGNYTESLKQKQLVEKNLQKKHLEASLSLKKIKKEVSRRREEASRSDKRVSKKGLNSKDHDSKSKINLAKLTGKDGTAGKKLNQITGRLSQAQKKLDELNIKKSFRTGVNLTGGKIKRNILFELQKNRIKLSHKKTLCFDNLFFMPDDRIGITGSNGFGKTTLLNYILNSMDIDDSNKFYLPQEIDISDSIKKIDEIRKLPKEELGKIMIIISRLGSRPDRLLDSREPSPGEIRKILLAEGISRNPHIIIMDEPTNHLDLPSVESLEEALLLCGSSLLLVSHDIRFIEKLTNKRWDISSINSENQNSINEGIELLKVFETIV